MNKKTQIVALALLGACALSASAQVGWTIVGPSAVTTINSASGTGVYTFTPNTSGTLIPSGNAFAWTPSPPYFGASPIATYTVVGSEPSTYTAGVPFSIDVAWTINSFVPSAVSGTETFFLDTSSGYQTTGQSFTVAASTPEPAQTIAGAMLLGCGGLIFASRRLLKK